MVYRVIKSKKFMLGFRRIKATYVDADMEGGKQEVQEQVSVIKFNSEPSVVVV